MLTRKKARDIRRGILSANYLIGLPIENQLKTLIAWVGMPDDPQQDTLSDRAYRRTVIRYLQSQDK